ncbi:MAG: hypothetical protein ACOC2D_09055 [Spirochaetota bacterium]
MAACSSASTAARALRAVVLQHVPAAAQKEIGWWPFSFAPAYRAVQALEAPGGTGLPASHGEASDALHALRAWRGLLERLPSRLTVLHRHGDTFDRRTVLQGEESAMKTRHLFALLAAIAATLGACATNKLEGHTFAGEPLRLIVRVAPEARVDADYVVSIDSSDPVATALSIGTTIAKASQVEKAQAKTDAAMRELDMEAILADEVGAYFADVMEMRVIDSRRAASYLLSVCVDEYGIEASGRGSSVEFILRGKAEMYDNAADELVWDERFRRSEQFSPGLFGLPASAGNVFSAAMLYELTEQEIAAGIERVTRDAAWEISSEFERDLHRSRR